MSDILHLYDLVLGLLSSVGIIYLLYSQQFVASYRRFLYLVIAGFLVFSVGGPLVDLYRPGLAHLVHGIAALLVVGGLYPLVHADLPTDEWTKFMLREPSELRSPGEWMVPMDDKILELFHSTHLTLTPSLIAYNIDHSREEVNRRLTELEAHDLVKRVDHGKYRITEFGEQYLHGVQDEYTSLTATLESKLTHR